MLCPPVQVHSGLDGSHETLFPLEMEHVNGSDHSLSVVTAIERWKREESIGNRRDIAVNFRSVYLTKRLSMYKTNINLWTVDLATKDAHKQWPIDARKK